MVILASMTTSEVWVQTGETPVLVEASLDTTWYGFSYLEWPASLIQTEDDQQKLFQLQLFCSHLKHEEVIFYTI